MRQRWSTTQLCAGTFLSYICMPTKEGHDASPAWKSFIFRAPYWGRAPMCRWDVYTQSFDGSGCVSDDTVSCLCTHLTDFGSFVSPPKIQVLSLSQLFGSKIEVSLPMLIVILSILGAVGLSWAFFLVRSKLHHHAVLESLQSDEYGFRKLHFTGPMGETCALTWGFCDPYAAIFYRMRYQMFHETGTKICCRPRIINHRGPETPSRAVRHKIWQPRVWCRCSPAYRKVQTRPLLKMC